MFEFVEQSYQIQYEEPDDDLEEIQEFLEESNERTKQRLKEELEGERKDLRFEQKNFKENTELIYERISDLKNEIEELTRRGLDPEPQRKEHLEDELFKMYRHLIDQKDRWADRRTEIKRRIRKLGRELQELEDSDLPGEFV